MDIARPIRHFTLNGTTYSAEDLLPLSRSAVASEMQTQALLQFLHAWFSPAEFLDMHTSGSTGTPKRIRIMKENMRRSAKASIRFFNLQPAQRVLLALPLHYIAGAMMTVRALEAEMDILTVAPSLLPLPHDCLCVDFAPLTPAQLYGIWQANRMQEIARINTVLLGGGEVPMDMEERLQSLPNHFYSSYGMTETLSHIALRKLNGSNRQARYYPLPEVKLAMGNAHNLIIETPWTVGKIITNDLVALHADGSFEWLGRKDFAINSGGVTLLPEQIEAELRPYIAGAFAISSLPHQQWGSQVVLITEQPISFSHLLQQAQLRVSKHHLPKTHYVFAIPRTATGKIARQQLQDQLSKQQA